MLSTRTQEQQEMSKYGELVLVASMEQREMDNWKMWSQVCQVHGTAHANVAGATMTDSFDLWGASLCWADEVGNCWLSNR